MKKQIILEFIEAINSTDTDKLCGLMADDHIFIDSLGNKFSGKENMKKAWTGYFEMFPDYRIEANEILEKGDLICILGYAGGTYKNLKNKDNSNYWRVPAAWRAIVSDNKIKQWQVYADNSVVIEIVSRNG